QSRERELAKTAWRVACRCYPFARNHDHVLGPGDLSRVGARGGGQPGAAHAGVAGRVAVDATGAQGAEHRTDARGAVDAAVVGAHSWVSALVGPAGAIAS